MNYRRDTELPGVTKSSFYTTFNERNGEEPVKYTFVYASIIKGADLGFNPYPANVENMVSS